MEFERDLEKAAANATKHGIDFSEAMTAFADPLESTIADPDHSEGEQRFLSIGLGAIARGSRLSAARQATPETVS
jgi:uncharacterized DUF497 family protein